MSASPLRILTFTTLFPNREQPTHGIFVEHRLRQVLASGEVAVRVMAPVPWFPSRNDRFGAYAQLARVPQHETRHGIAITHPRFISLPRIGMHLAPLLLYLSVRRAVREIIAQGFDFDLIDAHYYYPDGVAAAFIARELGKPFVVTARGSDINLIAEFRVPRRMMLWTARNAAATITVSGALKARLAAFGADAHRIKVLRNGVDLALFRPCERNSAKRKYGVEGPAPVLISVGNLIQPKGHHIAIEATAYHPSARLLVVGAGPERPALQALAGRLGISERVYFLGRVGQAELPETYSAADILILASSREGWANVLLEAMACGTPIVATDVGGTPEVITEPAAGLLVKERTAPAFAEAVARLLDAPPTREATRRYAESFSWEATTRGQLALFWEIVGARRFRAEATRSRLA
jgi:glycosyltransferase involved in cell wall biosynthesis